MKRLGFPSESISIEGNVNLNTKPSQTAELQHLYNVC